MVLGISAARYHYPPPLAALAASSVYQASSNYYTQRWESNLIE